MTPASRFRLRYAPLEPGNDYLPDGRRVWWQRDEYDCLTCCLATVFKCDYDEVPDKPLNPDDESSRAEAGDRLIRWVNDRGFDLTLWRRAPVHYANWIGLDEDPGDIAGNHAVVCSFNAMVFDPALAWPVPPGTRVQTTSKLTAAYTFDRREPA